MSKRLRFGEFDADAIVLKIEAQRREAESARQREAAWSEARERAQEERWKQARELDERLRHRVLPNKPDYLDVQNGHYVDILIREAIEESYFFSAFLADRRKDALRKYRL